VVSTTDIADALIACQDCAGTIDPITRSDPAFDVLRAYDVLAAINARREAAGWVPIGRKIGFTNHTIWERYGVYQPMWAPVWSQTVHFAERGAATLPLAGFVRPRIEPEVVFKLRTAPPPSEDPMELIAAVEWIAAGFEIVQSVFPDWRFAAADCTAASGLHAALLVGTPLAVTLSNREELVARLPTFELTLARDGGGVDRGTGSNVLGSPLNALAHLIRVLAGQPHFAPLAAGEIVTTGTVTDAWPVRRGETWESRYGSLGVEGLRLRFA
jgi:2-oxo-3-hexenedioate decarboxylase